MRCNTSLTKDEIIRYSRQIRLAEVGKEGQRKIKGTSVLVVGAGALGCPVLQYLTAAEVGIPVIDLRDKDDTDDIGFKTITIPYYDVSRKVKLFSDKDAVVFYCRSGTKSTTVINYLQKVHKLENLYNLVK